MNDTDLWIVIVLLAIGTFAIRYSFLGLVGGRQMPDWLLRHLRYAAVAVLPGVVMPLVVWPQAGGGAVDPIRIAAAAATLGVGYLTRNVFWAMGAGAVTLYGLLAVAAFVGPI